MEQVFDKTGADTMIKQRPDSITGCPDEDIIEYRCPASEEAQLESHRETPELGSATKLSADDVEEEL